MRKIVWRVLLCVSLLLVLFVPTALAKKQTLTERQEALRQKVTVALDKLYARQPKSEGALDKATGRAVFVSSGYKLGIFGSSHGRGIAYNNQTGDEVFMRMNEYEAGLGLGAKEYILVFAFANQDAWDSFVRKGWSFGGKAEMSATDGVNGDSFEGAIQVAPGIWVYQLTTKGLSMSLALKGTNYYRDKEMNGDKK
jgi:lipid-binding SYLF domain-containing protein